MTSPRAFLLLGLAIASMAAPSRAASVLNQYNLVTLGDARGQSHVDYNAFIGGNLTTQGGGGNMDFSLHSYTLPGNPSSAVGLTVVGNVVAQNAGTFKVLNNKTALVGGTISPSNALQAASITVGTPQNGLAAQLAAQKTSIAAEMAALSTAYSLLTANSSLRLPQPGEPIQNAMTFVAQPVNGLAIFNISLADLTPDNINDIFLAQNNATSIVINVHGAGTLDVTRNLVGSSWGKDSVKANTLWNFVDATALNINRNWYGAILAPKATVTNYSNIDGSVFVNSINLRAEIHKPFYTGYVPNLTPAAVPEPASLAMAGLGFGALALAARRLRR